MSSRQLPLSAPAVGLIFAGFVYSQTPEIREVGNAASLVRADAEGHGVAPRSIVSIFGENLANTTAEGGEFPLPNSIAGTRVLFNGQSAPLLYVSPTQINAQVPSGSPVGKPAQVTVATGSASSNTVGVNIQEAAFGIFTRDATGCGQGVILNIHADGALSVNSPQASFDPLNDGGIAVFGTGLGRVLPAQPDGVPWRFDPQASTPFFMGLFTPPGSNESRFVRATYAGPAPGLVGVDQVNLVPVDITRNAFPQGCRVPLQVADGLFTTSQAVSVSVRDGGGVCEDPPLDSYMTAVWERIEDAGNVEERLVLRLWGAPGLRLTPRRWTLGGGGIEPVSPPPAPPRCRDPQLKILDGGAITVSGPGLGPFTISPDSVTLTGEYRVNLPAGSLHGGEYRLEVSGGADVGAFASTVRLPEPIRVTTDLNPGAVLPRGNSDRVLSWTGGEPGSFVVATLLVPTGGQILSNTHVGRASDGRLLLDWPILFGFLFSPGQQPGIPEADDIALSVQVVTAPPDQFAFSAPGLTQGGLQTWNYEYHFSGLKTR